MSNASYWTTKDGRRLKISRLDDSHLINILKFIKKTSQAKLIIERGSLMSFLLKYQPQGEMAQDALDREEIYLFDIATWLDYAKEIPQYENLCKEADKRGLTWDIDNE